MNTIQRSLSPFLVPVLGPAVVLALTLVSALSTLPSGASAQDYRDAYPKNPGIDMLGYVFELTLSDQTDVVEGVATATARYVDGGQRELRLDLIQPLDSLDGAGMTVSRVTTGDDDLAFRQADHQLLIDLGRTIPAGERVQVQVHYSGRPSDGLDIGPNRYGDRTFFSDNWSSRVRAWLPVVDHPYDKATTEMIVTAPSHYQVASNGTVAEESGWGDGMRRTHYVNPVPTATWLYFLGVARFAVQQLEPWGDVPIETWVYWQDREAGFYDFAVPTKAAMEFYDEYVGPYAYERIANITSPVTGGGMEAATSIMYHESSVTGERTVRWRNVIIHEVAHQWFGNAVTESDWDDIWLSEGFATYFTLLFIEHAYGRDEFVAGLRSSADRVFAQYADDPGYRIVHDDLSDMRRVTSGATYQKGSWILHMLRSQMGDEAFWAGISAYYERYMNRNATTADFRREMESASGMDLEAFFQQWLYEGGNPRLEGWWTYDPTAEAVQIEINQTQTTGPTFAFPLEIGVYFDGESRPRTVEAVEVDGRFHRFVVPVDGEPTNVTLDPDVKTLFEADFGPRER